MSRPLSPDELDLEPEVLSDEDMAAWIASIESSPDTIRDELESLGEAARRALATHHSEPTLTTGRALRNTTMTKLEQRGLVRRDGDAWTLTNFGRNVGKYLVQSAATPEPCR